MMSLLLKLQQEETNKNYKKYCEIADEFLCSDEPLIPLILKRHIQARRNFYMRNLLLKTFQISDIIKKIDSDVIQVLKRCCPGFTDVIRLPDNYDWIAPPELSCPTDCSLLDVGSQTIVIGLPHSQIWLPDRL